MKKEAILNLQNLYNYYASHPESSWITNPDNAPSLYKFVQKNNPKKILDLGTGIGCTAAIISLALKSKKIEDFEIHTVEQFQKCVDIAQKIIPKILKENITFHLTEAVPWSTEHIPYHYFNTYKKLPKIDWDFIFVDGPGGFTENEKYVDVPRGDVIKMLLDDDIKPGTFVTFDRSIPTLKIVERYFSDNFYFIPTENTVFNVLERKDNKVKCVDEAFEAMKKYGYFKGTVTASAS